MKERVPRFRNFKWRLVYVWADDREARRSEGKGANATTHSVKGLGTFREA